MREVFFCFAPLTPKPRAPMKKGPNSQSTFLKKSWLLPLLLLMTHCARRTPASLWLLRGSKPSPSKLCQTCQPWCGQHLRTYVSCHPLSLKVVNLPHFKRDSFPKCCRTKAQVTRSPTGLWRRKDAASSCVVTIQCPFGGGGGGGGRAFATSEPPCSFRTSGNRSYQPRLRHLHLLLRQLRCALSSSFCSAQTSAHAVRIVIARESLIRGPVTPCQSHLFWHAVCSFLARCGK